MARRRNSFRGMLALALLASCLLCGCPQGDGREFGQNFMNVASDSHVALDEYRYVADSSKLQYWPNTPKYRSRIRREDRVYILDYETLKEFHGYKAGPK